mgnify:CR=1 FL=1
MSTTTILDAAGGLPRGPVHPAAPVAPVGSHAPSAPPATPSPAPAKGDYSHYRVVPARHRARAGGPGVSAVVIALVLYSVLTNPRWGWGVFGEYFFSEPVLVGLGRTLLLTALGALFGFTLGTALALARVSRSPLLAGLSWTFIWIFRSIPVIVLLLIINNLGYLYETVSLGVPFTDWKFFSYPTTQLISPFVAALIGLTLNQAAFASEIVRGGILSVDQGQLEAAAARVRLEHHLAARAHHLDLVAIALAEVGQDRAFAAVHPVSALKRNGLDVLIKELLALLPEAPPMFGEDEITDRSERFLAAELVREQLMRQLGAELPYATTVEIENFTTEASPKGELARIGAVIWVERESQKAIVIGKGGARLKEIGSKSRQQMEHLFGRKVFLETWCRVREGWSDDEAALRRFGYSD